MAKKIAQYQIDLEVLANSRDNLKEVQSKLETTDKIIKSLNDTGLKYFKNLVKEIDKIPQAISKADKALQLSTQTVKEAYTLKSGGIGFRNVRSSESRKATSEALGSLPDLKNFDAKTGLANDFNTITGKVTENIQKLNILKNVLKEVRDNYKNASGEAKKYWDYVEKNVSAKIGKIQNELHGGEKGFRDLRSFFKDMKDLASWQMRWYGAKAFLFTPMEIGAKTLKSYVSWEQAMKNASAVSEYTADDLEMLKKVTLDIGKTTSISAKEAAGALMEFAQAGIKAEVAAVALPLAAKMVIPTGEKMGVAVSALTTAFNAWKLSANDVPRVASEIGAAMADSKLKIADLSTVFNYLATVSADFNLSTKETLALTTLLSKAGVMPSTIGTGTRQTLTLMAKMPKRMKDMLNEAGKPYGWTAKDFSTDLNPPIEALKKLFTLIKDGVIGATELFKGFELRAGANVIALSRLFLEEWDKTLQVIGDPKWLDRAFKTSMGGIENQLKRTGNIIEAEIYPLLDKVGGRFAKILEAINDFEVRTGLIKSLLEVIVVLGAVKLLTLFPKFIAYLGTIIAKLGTINTMLGTLSAGWTIPVVVGVSLFLILKGIVGKGIEVEASEAGEAIKKLTTEQLDNVLKDLNEKVSKSGFQTEVTKQFYKDIGKWSLIQQPELGRQATIDLITRELSKRRGSPENMSQYEPSPAGKKESGQGKGMLGQQLALDKKDRNEAINLQKAYLSLQDAIWESSYKLGLMSSKDYFNKREEIAKESYNIMKKDAEEYLADFTNKNSKLYGEYQQQLADAEKIEDVKERAEKKAYIIQQFEVARKEGVRKLATLEIEESKRILKATQEMLEKEKDLYIKHQNTLLDIKKIRLEKEIEAEAARLERTSISNEYAYSKGKISAEAYYNQEATKLNIERLSTIEKAENDYLSAKQKAANDFLYIPEGYEMGWDNLEAIKQYNDANKKALEERNKIVQNANDKQATSLLQLQIKKAEDIKAIYGSSGVSGVIGKAFEDLNTEWSNTGQHIYDTTKNIVTNMENSFADFFDYMSEGFMDFENLAKNVLHTIYMELLKNILLKQVLSGIFGSATGQGGLGSFLSGLFPGKASGGSVSLNTPYIVGESGPELFVPNASGNIIPNNRLGTSSAPTLIVNVENKTGKQVKATQSQPQFDGKKWVRSVLLELADSDMAVRSRYSVR